MKKRLYIETTVVSYFVSRPSRDIIIAGHQKATREVWPRLAEKYEAFISALVYDEAGRGDAAQARLRLAAIKPFPMFQINHEAQDLAEKIISKKAIHERYPEDALHVALAAINGADIIVTWNFTHLNNPFTRRRVRQVVEREGYACPEICSPEELLEAEI